MIRVGIVGTSWWTDSMYLPALADHPEGHVVALCGRNHDRARALADQWGIPAVFTDWQQMIDSNTIDAVIVASGNDTHFPVTLAAIDAGLHVLCEKPLGLTVSEADRMAAHAATTDLVTMVPFTYQYMPMFTETKRLLDDGFLATPHHLNIRYFAQYGLDPSYAWRFDNEFAGSGVIGDLGSHCLFYAEWLFGPIEALGCTTGSFVDREPRPDGSTYAQAEDSSLITARYSSGAIGTIQACSVSWEGTPFGQTHHIDAHGSGGTIYATSDWDTVQEIRVLPTGESGPSRPMDWKDRWPGVRTDTVHNTYRDVFRSTDVMTRQWIHDIMAGRPSEPDLAAGARVQHLLDAALTSAAEDGRMLPVAPTAE